MNGIQFTKVPGGKGLYSASPAGGPVVLYYQSLTLEDPASTGPMDLWENDPGGWFFAPADSSIASPQDFGRTLKQALQNIPQAAGFTSGDPKPNARWIGWLSDPNAPADGLKSQLETQYIGRTAIGSLIYVEKNANGTFALEVDTNVRFGTLVLNLQPQSTIEFKEQTAFFEITGVRAGNGPQLQQVSGKRDATLFIPDQQTQGSVDVELLGDQAGLICFDLDPPQRTPTSANDFFGLIYLSRQPPPWPEIRYYAGPSGNEQELSFPLPLDPAPDELHLSVCLDPLNPFDGGRTLFGFNASNYPDGVPACKSFRTPIGNTVVLTPEPGAGGFGLGKGKPPRAIRGAPEGGYSPYLTPAGLWKVTVESADVTAATPGPIQIICGLGGTEFLLVESGDALEFVGGQPAVATSFTTAAPARSGLSGSKYNTAWVRVRSAAPTGLIPSYCVQANDYVYFGPAGGADYPAAVGCRMADLSDAASTNPVPMVPYSSIYAEAGTVHSNARIDTTTFASFERLVVAPNRRLELRPKFDYQYGPRYFDLASNTAFASGTMRTSKGFLAEFATATRGGPPAGTIQTLQIAKSPPHSALAGGSTPFLAFENGDNGKCPTRPDVTPSNKVVSPCLTNALEDDNLFLVAARTDAIGAPTARPFGRFANQVSIGEFQFQWDTDSEVAATGTGGAVLLFKFVSGASITSLVADTSQWAETESFIGGGSQGVTAVQAELQGWIRTAATNAASSDPDVAAYFADIHRKFTDPDWTGILALNTPLPYGQLSPDLQMLLGGISGTLRGFHFGVTANRIGGSPGDGSIDNSSLFGLIFYQESIDTTPATQKQAHFQVPEFKALFTNSALARFEARVAMTIPELFGDEVALTEGSSEDKTSTADQPSGILVIDGAYQKNAHGGEGAVVFDSSSARTFDFKNLPGQLTPGFRPVTEVETGNADLAPKSSVASGSTTTVEADFSLSGRMTLVEKVGTGTGADLFSYGDASDPSGPTFSNYAFEIETTITGNTATLGSISFDPGAVRLSDEGVSLRADSLLGTLPTSLKQSLQYKEAGLTPSGSWRIVDGPDDALANVAPQYALAYNLPLGGLGALVSSDDKLTATLYLGWTAAGSAVADDDQVALILELPTQFGGGSFKLEGVFDTSFESIAVETLALTPPSGVTLPSTTLWAFQLKNVSIRILGIPIVSSGDDREIDLFGNPHGPQTLDLLWHLGGKDPSGSPLLPFLTLNPLFGVTSGVDISLPATQVSTIGTAVRALTGLPKTTDKYINKLLGTVPNLKLDPSSGLVIYLSISYAPISLQLVFDDPSFYGGLLAVGPSGDDDDDKKKKGSSSEEDSKDSEGTQTTESGTQTDESGTETTESGTQTNETGTETAESGTETSESGTQTTESGTQTTESGTQTTESGTQTTESGTQTTESGTQTTEPGESGSTETTATQTTSDDDSDDDSNDDSDDGGGDDSDDGGDDDSDDGGGDDLDNPLSLLNGLMVEFTYRKINDHLGVYTFDIVLPQVISTIYFGEKSDPDTPVLTLPEIGIQIYTNSDWKVSVGWPFASATSFASAQQLSLLIPIEEVPILFAIGFYLAKLHGEDIDLPFGLIWEFGIGLSGGPDIMYQKGPVSAEVSLLLHVQMQGFLGSNNGQLTHSVGEYYWYAVSVSGSLLLMGSVNLEIITASLTLRAELSISVAWETDHRTQLVVAVAASLDLEVTVVFFSVSVRFHAELKVIDHAFGPSNEPEAKLSGPTPPMAMMTSGTSSARRIGGTVGAAAAVSLPPKGANVAITVGFGLQPTAVIEETSGSKTSTNPQAVATLLVQSPTGAPPNADNPFGKFARNVAAWVINEYQGTFMTAAELLANVNVKLTDGTFASAASTCLSQTFHFTIHSASTLWPTSGAMPTVAVLPVFPELALRHAGGPAKAFTATAKSVLDDYVVLVARQMIGEIQTLVGDGMTLTDALDQVDYGNVAGFATRFLQHGLRMTSGGELEALALLTGQQVALTGTPPKRDFELSLATGEPPTWITLQAPPASASSSGGSSSGSGSSATQGIPETLDESLVLHASWNPEPPWTAAPLPPTVPVQQSYLLAKKLAVGTEKVICTLPEALRVEVLAQDGLRLAPEIPASGSTPAKPFSATPAVRIPIEIEKVSQPGAGGATIPDVYRVVGANEADREPLTGLLEAVDAGTVSISDLEIYRAPSAGNLTAVPTTGIVLAKTDLADVAALGDRAESADGAPSSSSCADSAALASSPTPSQATDFLRIVWEASVVRRAGFYLYGEAIAQATFTGGTARLTLVVETTAADSSNSAGLAGVAVAPFQNALVVAASSHPDGPSASQTLAVKVFTSDGTAHQIYHPNLGAGSAGWKLTWPNAPTSVAAANSTTFLKHQYHLVSTQIASPPSGVSSAPSKPIGPLHPQPGASASDTWQYHYEAPIYGSGDSPYEHVGKSVTFDIHRLDVFGNALPASEKSTVESTVVYNDPLLSIDMWEGSHFTYSIGAGSASDKTGLTLTVSFNTGTFAADPSQPTAAEATHASHALARYRKVKDQLADPNVTLSIRPYFLDSEGRQIGLAGAPITENAAGNTVQSQLSSSLIDPAIAWLTAVSGSTAPPAAPQSIEIKLDLDKNHPMSLPVDLFPLTVRLAIDRAHVTSEIAQQIPAAAKVSHGIPPLQDPTKTPDGDAYRQFAMAFETAYADYDGSQGVLKLAQSRVPGNVGSTQRGGLWVSRWGTTGGLDVSFSDSPVYLAPTPLSTQLLTGKFEVRNYASTWRGTDADFTTKTEQFNSVDLDAWMSEFLSSFTEVLAPRNATAIAAIEGRYGPLIDAKRTLAEQLSVNSTGTAGSRVAPIIEGRGTAADAEAAANVFKEALLSRLETDYSLSAIVQVPATVGVGGSNVQVEEPVSGSTSGGSSIPPSVYGKVVAKDQTADAPYTFSPTALPLAAGNETAEFLVSAKHPGAQEQLDLSLTYKISFLEHDFRPAESDCGYVPSSWLAFILPENGEELSPAIGKVKIPIPLRSFPPPPILLSQSALPPSSPGSGLSGYNHWTYQMTVARPKAEQDDLVLTVTFNRPTGSAEGAATDSPSTAPASSQATGTGSQSATPSDLFEALARFHYEWPSIQSHLSLVDGTSTVGPVVVERYQDLVDGVTATLPQWQNPAKDATAADSSTGSSLPAVESWSYRLELFVADQPAMRVTRLQQSSGDLPPWPKIAGYETPSGSDATADYAPSGSPSGPIALTWTDLSLLSHQSVQGGAHVERNVDIAEQGETTNPAFVYRTSEVVFPNVLTPLIEDSSAIPLASGSSLDAALGTLLEGVFSSGPPSDQMVHFELVVGYEYELVASPSGTSDPPLVSRGPVFLVQEQIAFGDVETTFKNRLAKALEAWHTDRDPSEAGGILSFALTLFAADSISEGSLVLLDLGDIRIPLPASTGTWWTVPSS